MKQRSETAQRAIDPKERLDSLNARWRQRQDAPNAIRRTMEAHIEANARNQRSEAEMASGKRKRPVRN